MDTSSSIINFDTELLPGASNAINTCLALKPDEKITIITDNDCLEIASSLLYEVKKIGSPYNFIILEDLSPRPLKKMPQKILEELSASDVSIFCAQAKEGELGSRIQMTNIINERKIRHAHMVNISKQIMNEGMRADFIEIDKISERLIEKARKASIIKAISDNGTDITAKFSPEIKWIKTSGLISSEKWGNLPGGEIFTSPSSINGRFLVDGVVGDYLCQKYGNLKDSPLIIDIENSRIKHLECSNSELLKEFTEYTMTDDNSNRVGEFAIGTNIAVEHVIGQILQDEKLPTIHIAFGHPYSEHTGAGWFSSTHIDCVSVKNTIFIDDEKVMENGKFLI
jgi:leucyl aminopeptidase (aminopeptidase T)